ncbi:MAG: hypothetical protein HY307_00145 [Arcobacter sp.]|nr:hypothetical protein [Arcobacter sp.]
MGSATGGGAINPLDLSGDTSFASVSTKAKNIAMLLQNLDQNRTDTNKIVIASALKDHNFGDLNLSSTALEASMNTILADSNISANIDQINNTVITQADANTAMTNYLKGFIAGSYSGTFSLKNQIVAKNLVECSNSGTLSMALTNNGSTYSMSSIFEIVPNTPAEINWSNVSSIKNLSLTGNANSPYSPYSVNISNVNINGKTITGNYLFSHNGLALCSGTYLLSK